MGPCVSVSLCVCLSSVSVVHLCESVSMCRVCIYIVCVCVRPCVCRVCVLVVSVRACVCVYFMCACVYVRIHVCCVCVCVNIFACVLPHLYSGVCYASVQCICTLRGPDGDTMYSILSGGCFQFLCGKCCSEWSALYSCWIVLSCGCACLIFSAVKPACTVVKAAWRVSICGPLLHNSASVFPLVVPFLYTVSKVNSCIARAQ